MDKEKLRELKEGWRPDGWHTLVPKYHTLHCYAPEFCVSQSYEQGADAMLKAVLSLLPQAEPVSEDLVEQVAHGFSEHKAGHCPPTSNEAICADLKSCCNLCWTKHVISLIRPVIEKEEKDKWIAACAYHGIKIEQPQQLKRIIAQLKEAGE